MTGTVALADRGWQETGSVTARRTASVFAGFRFPPDVISVAVRWYPRYGLSYRDAGELLAEGGVTVTRSACTGGCSGSARSSSRRRSHAAMPPGDRWSAGER
jgi:transposase, IS6 family